MLATQVCTASADTSFVVEVIAPTGSTRMLERPAVADWYPDPTGSHRLRYFNGIDWTDAVTHFGPIPCHGCGPHPNAAPYAV